MSIFILTGQFIIGLVYVIAVVHDLFGRRVLQDLLDTKLELLLKRKVPHTQYLLYGGMGLKVVCGLALMLNIAASVAAFFLAGFTIIANIIFNNFWAQQSTERQMAFLVFLINWGVIGGLIVLIGV